MAAFNVHSNFGAQENKVCHCFHSPPSPPPPDISLAFLPRISHLLISWPQLLSEVILEPKKIKSVTASTFSPSMFYEVKGLDAMILVF